MSLTSYRAAPPRGNRKHGTKPVLRPLCSNGALRWEGQEDNLFPHRSRRFRRVPILVEPVLAGGEERSAARRQWRRCGQVFGHAIDEKDDGDDTIGGHHVMQPSIQRRGLANGKRDDCANRHGRTPLSWPYT